MQHDSDLVLIEHALETPANLEIALDIAFAFDKLRYRIIGDAMRELEARVRAGLGGAPWEVRTNFNHQPIPANGYFKVRSQQWAAEYSVRLASDQRSATKLYIGLHFAGDEPLVDHKALWEGLAHIRPGRAQQTPQYGWLWWDWLEAPLSNWSSKAALLEFATKDADALSDLAAELVSVAAAVGPILTRSKATAYQSDPQFPT